MKKKLLTTTRIIALGFLITIIIGTILLSLPIAVAPGNETDILTAAFTSTTSVCVTGLVVVDTFSYWSIFGKCVILLLIQIGGLGIVSITTLFMLMFRRKITLKSTMLMQDAYNLDSRQGLLKFTKRVFKSTMIVEGIGALIYCIEFCSKYGFFKGVCFSVFHSVSAFCNAGIDILGANSLMNYTSSPLMLVNTAFLIIMGGLGFIVWWDVENAITKMVKDRFSVKRAWFGISLQSKLVLIITLFLLLSGTLLIYLLEYKNPETLGNMKVGDKVLNSFFQSVTLRTAGFAAIPQGSLREVTALICILYMFIGGSPVGTAGGVKTVTMAVIIFTFLSMLHGDDGICVFKKQIPPATVKKAVTVVFISFSTITVMVILLLLTNNIDVTDGLYEVVSAVCTVGLSRNLTTSLNDIGRIIIIICMYLGRVGPISMLIAFNTQKNKTKLLKYPEENIIVG